MPDAGIVATIMLLVGLFLLGLEFFIPSFGMILILALISLVVSFWAACKAWYGTSPVFFWSYVLMGCFGIPLSLMGAIWLMQRTSLGSKIILQGPERKEKAKNPLEELIGQTGESVTMMAPGGIVLIENQRYHAESIGMIIDPETAIVVTGIKGNRLVVRPIVETENKRAFESSAGRAVAETVIGTEEASPKESENPSDETKGAESKGADHLDFEIPDE